MLNVVQQGDELVVNELALGGGWECLIQPFESTNTVRNGYEKMLLVGLLIAVMRLGHKRRSKVA